MSNITQSPTERQRAADKDFAVQLVLGSLPFISDGYRELVERFTANPVVSTADSSPSGTSTTLGDVLSSAAFADIRKKNQELVTRGEKLAGQFIRKQLSSKRPNDNYKGEETGLLVKSTTPGRSVRRLWLDDPVDGTASMVMTAIAEASGIALSTPTPRFAITVGLVENGIPVVGVVAELATHPDNTELVITRMSIGVLHDSTYHVETRLPNGAKHSTPQQPNGLRVLCTAPEVMFLTPEGNRDPRKEAGFESLLTELDVTSAITKGNAAAMVDLGENDVVYERDLTIEDLAAVVPYLRDMGFLVTRPDGSELTFDDPNAEYTILAAKPQLHARALEAIRMGERAVDDNLHPPTPYFDGVHAGGPTGYAQKFSGGSQGAADSRRGHSRHN